MDTSYHKNSTATSARASDKKMDSKTTSARSNEKSHIETKKTIQTQK
ncbi:hypothetical protein KHA90_10920 [Flavobacterium psychroterrae]|jgi:hypothetical protein|uniref:Uncharacterized protein n=1 Tax=Flavobacterium psychroterrae TaxID=2133767 RepID=A0ABS5PB72_9FLAO|nr:hypothetical protein [Flavobacterium psychroterrae]MBS7231534.1 hypothetical protein [Flavobacterium psychroterrae]